VADTTPSNNRLERTGSTPPAQPDRYADSERCHRGVNEGRRTDPAARGRWVALGEDARQPPPIQEPEQPGTVTVAGKPSLDVPPGTLNTILKQAGLKKAGSGE